MDIIVCLKQVADPETPPRGFKVDEKTKKVIPPIGAAPVMNPFDENAVEAALRVKDTHGSKVTALTMGPVLSEDVLKHAMSMGVDEGVLLENPNPEDMNSYATAYCLAMAIKKMGNADLIFCGREAADWNAGQVGLGIAEFLDIAAVTLVRKVEIWEGRLKVERVIPDGFEVVESPLPALLTITNELGNPRYPTVKGVMAAKKREITIWGMADIHIDSSELDTVRKRLHLVDIVIPVYQRECHIFKANTPEDEARAMAKKIMELNPR